MAAVPALATAKAVAGALLAAAAKRVSAEEVASGCAPKSGGEEVREEKARTPLATPRTPLSVPQNKTTRFTETERRRKQFILQDLIQDMQLQKILAMKEEFDRSQGGVSLDQFIRIMHQQRGLVNTWDAELVSKLRDLFTEIDIDENHQMSFEEFTTYLVQTALHNEALNPQYQEVPLHVDDHQAYGDFDINCIKHVPELERIFVCCGFGAGGLPGVSDGKPLIRVYKSITPREGQPKLKLMKELVGHQKSVLALAHIPAANFIATSGIDHRLMLWDVNANFRLRSEHLLSSPAMSLCTLETQAPRLLTTTARGALQLYAFNADAYACAAVPGGAAGDIPPTSPIRTVWQAPHAHADMATYAINISESQVASCGLDRVVSLWDVHAGTRLRDFQGHATGVYRLAYYPYYRVLLSAGADRDALVFNTVTPQYRPIGRLRGHRAPLVGVEVAASAPQAVTADASGVFRIWDLRTFDCVQKFSMSDAANRHEAHAQAQAATVGCAGTGTMPPRPPSASATLGCAKGPTPQEATTAVGAGHHAAHVPHPPRPLSSFCFCSDRRQILAADRHLHCFMFDEPFDSWLTDNGPIVRVQFNSYSMTICTVSPRAVKVRKWLDMNK
eukprot:TRINITY_DN772_c0_g5_i1.p1 TRINITY_DN772_c0_g5~~TRINITY_DN772_c0_g5_i1.p1  ORF type:complete len:692 (-),score=174.86 TRINITY_DN772_c0_g5_i1:3861-5711(-)